MLRRKFLTSMLALSGLLLPASSLEFKKLYREPKVEVDKLVDRKIVEKGVGEFALFNTEGQVISRKSFETIHMASGDTLEIKYTIEIV